MRGKQNFDALPTPYDNPPMRTGILPSVLAILLLHSIRVRAADTPAAWPPIYSVPELANIKIDGNGSDWRDRGFRIDVLAPLDGRVVPSTEFDATVRLGWQKNAGLLLLVTVVDSTPVEKQELSQLEQGDSVELFVVPKDGRPFSHYVIGADRNRADHLRRYRVSNPGVGTNINGRKMQSGYQIEALIPEVAELDQISGMSLQIIVNDAAPGRAIRRYAWYPADDTAEKHEHIHRLKFAAVTSPPVSTAVAGVYDSLRRSRVTLVTTSDLLGHRIEASTGASLREIVAGNNKQLPVALVRIGSIADRTAASLTFPLPPLGKPYEPLNIYVDSQLVSRLTPVNIDARRRHALANIDLKFNPAVFSEGTFPHCDFADPAYARDLIGGGYTFKATFYNVDHEPVEKPDKPGRYGAVVEITTDAGVPLPARLVTLFKSKEAGARRQDLELHTSLPPQMGLDPEVVKGQQPAIAEHLTERFIDGFSAEPDAPLLLAALAESKPGDTRLAGMNSIWARDQRWWLPIKRKLGRDKYQCLIDLPEGYEGYDKYSGKVPLVLFLHGSGERGDEISQLRGSGLPKLLNEKSTAFFQEPAGNRTWPWPYPGFILLSPQCPAGEWWSAQQLIELLDQVKQDYRVDPDRIYVTGLSMGGYGAWELAEEFPDRFAAVVPICGAGNPQNAQKLKNVPIWAFHGQRDNVVPFQRSAEMVAALKNAGGRVRFTALPEAGHNAWDAAYRDSRLYQWLLRQKRGAPDEPPAKP